MTPHSQIIKILHLIFTLILFLLHILPIGLNNLKNHYNLFIYPIHFRRQGIYNVLRNHENYHHATIPNILYHLIRNKADLCPIEYFYINLLNNNYHFHKIFFFLID